MIFPYWYPRSMSFLIVYVSNFSHGELREQSYSYLFAFRDLTPYWRDWFSFGFICIGLFSNANTNLDFFKCNELYHNALQKIPFLPYVSVTKMVTAIRIHQLSSKCLLEYSTGWCWEFWVLEYPYMRFCSWFCLPLKKRRVPSMMMSVHFRDERLILI